MITTTIAAIVTAASLFHPMPTDNDAYNAAVAAAVARDTGTPQAVLMLAAERMVLTPQHSATATDNDLMTISEGTCIGFDANVPLASMLGVGIGAGMSAFEVGAIIDGAVRNLCPRNLPRMESGFAVLNKASAG